MEPYPSGQFGFIDDPDRQFGNGSVWTRTRTQSDGPEPLLTLHIPLLLGILEVLIPFLLPLVLLKWQALLGIDAELMAQKLMA